MAHILFITHWYPTPDNPVNGIFIKEHARAASQFHRVTILHIQGISRTQPMIVRETDGSLSVIRLSYPQPFIPKTGWFYRWTGTQRIFRELIQANNQPDIIHAHIYSSADVVYLLSRIYHCPAVLSEHASVYPRNLLTSSQLCYYRYFMNRLRIIMPVSEDLQHHMKRVGVQGSFRVIPNTVDTSLFHPAPTTQDLNQQPVRILTVAMLHPVKGVHFLLEAIARLKAMNTSCQLWIVGDGPERQRLEQMSKQLQISEIVSFLGIKTKSEVADLMRNADMFALTSIWENQPVVLIEAMASGLPVVAPTIGGIPEIVKSGCGVLFYPGNVEDLVEKLSGTIAHLNDYSSESSASYAYQEFGLQAVGMKLSDVYEKLLEKAH